MTTTFLSALRHDRLTASLVIDRALKSAIFWAYVEQVRLPTLRPGDIGCSTIGCHKTAGVRQALESVEAQLVYLPPYSPDFSPIEMVFARLKWGVRSAADECRGYLHHCGYGSRISS